MMATPDSPQPGDRADASPASKPGHARARLWPWIGAALGLTVFALALSALHRALVEFSWHQIRAEFSALDGTSLLLALAATAASYLLLTAFDWIGVRLSGRAVPFASVLRTAFIANALGHNLGMAALTGGAVRARAYGGYGLDAAQIGQSIASASIGFVLGAMAWLCVAMWADTADAAAALHLSPFAAKSLGAVIAIVLLCMLAPTLRGPRTLQWRRHAIALPGARTAVALLSVSVLELACAAGALYALLPEAARIGFGAFIGLYVIAIFAGLVSTVPAGLGVFEATLLLLLPDAPASSLLAAILAYRAVYYLLPLLLALALLTMGGVANRSLRAGVSRARRWADPLVPPAFATLVFVAGASLIINGSLPLPHATRTLLASTLPLGVLELSHLTASALGVALLILARGLYQRIRLAWWLSMLGLGVAACAALVDGLHWPLALMLLAVLAPLWWARSRFYRSAGLLDERGGIAWLRNAALVLVAAIWIGLLAHRHVEYSHALWWQFAFEADAPRMLRANLVAIVVLAVGMYGLLWPHRAAPPVATGDERARAARIIAASGDAASHLALLPDKQLLFAEDDAGFVMYQRAGPCLVAMSDPVGAPDAQRALAWRFRELADRGGAWTVFYQVSDAHLPTYLDMGLALTKLGEEAVVPLQEFSLQGPSRAPRRPTQTPAERDGASFEVLAPAQVAVTLPELREISEEWLGDRTSGKTAEKGFSLGYFDDGYLSQQPCAVVRVDDRIVAFANLWTSADRRALSFDLMRHRDDAPNGTMDYLLIELMLWGQRSGYRECNLGMTPLAGLSQHELAPLSHKLGGFAWRHGERFYNFEGLRRYKAKFQPQWRPRYLASPGGLKLPLVMFHLTRLISGAARRSVDS